LTAVRRTLPVLAMIAVLAVPLAGCGGGSRRQATPAAATPAADSTGDGVDPQASASMDGGQPVPSRSVDAAALAKTPVGQLMAKLGCHDAQQVETDPLSTQTGLCELAGDIIVNTFTSDAKRDEWVTQARTTGLGTVVGPLWAVGIEMDTDISTVVTKLGGRAN
jgi:hypothetical protein